MAGLTTKTVAALKEPGMFSDGDGLYLRVGPNGSKSWILRTVVQGRRRELGLGGLSWVTLAEAREAARQYRKIARQGGNPDTVCKHENLTFEAAARRYHATLTPTFKNPKHSALWLSSLERYAFPHFGSRPLNSIGTADVLKALAPIWTAKHDTARRVKQRVATIFDWAKGAGHYLHENPVAGLKKAMPTVKRQAKHMAALPWREVPAFITQLVGRDAVSARCLEFITLTASRSGEARGARWEEIDLEAGVWEVPGNRMKRSVPHRVPLSAEALTVLTRVRGLDPILVFPSPQRGPRGMGKELSVMAFKPLLDRMGVQGITVHGFRSTFRDWCSESAKADPELAEAALSHASGNAVTRAYARSDLFERRRELMAAWSRFVAGKAGQVVQMVRA